MSEPYIFVHIPKTAGTSFRKTLEDCDPVAILYDYGPNHIDVNGGLKEFIVQNKKNIICGHVSYKKYANTVAPKNVLSILRNPIERIVSEYQHKVRHNNLDMTLFDYSSATWRINSQKRLLDGLDINGVALIGITSHYNVFILLARKITGLQLATLSLNTAPKSDKHKRLELSAIDINELFRLNEIDLAFFVDVAESFRKKIEIHGINTIPNNSAKFEFRVDKKHGIYGWIEKKSEDCFFIALTVNGKIRCIVSPDEQRINYDKMGLSQSDFCGFSYPLSLLGAMKGDEVGMTVLGAPGFCKTLLLSNDTFPQGESTDIRLSNHYDDVAKADSGGFDKTHTHDLDVRTLPVFEVTRVSSSVTQSRIHKWHLDYPVTGQIFKPKSHFKLVGWMLPIGKAAFRCYIRNGPAIEYFEFNKLRPDVARNFTQHPAKWVGDNDMHGFKYELSQLSAVAGFELGFEFEGNRIPVAHIRVRTPTLLDIFLAKIRQKLRIMLPKASG